MHRKTKLPTRSRKGELKEKGLTPTRIDLTDGSIAKIDQMADSYLQDRKNFLQIYLSALAKHPACDQLVGTVMKDAIPFTP